MSDFFIFNDLKIKVQTLLSEEEQARGLMFVTGTPIPTIFPYNSEKISKFWMKNTYVPLDIIFCRQNKIIDIAQGQPLSLAQIGPDLPSDLVIELPYNFCNDFNLKIGDSIHIKYSLKTVARRLELLLSKYC